MILIKIVYEILLLGFDALQVLQMRFQLLQFDGLLDDAILEAQLDINRRVCA